jgi:MSHA biogenesis protein MshK
MRQLINFSFALFVAIAPVATYAFSDPTQPLGFAATTRTNTVSSAPSGPVLQSTLVSPQRRLAVISGKQVRVGDSLNGAVITEISPYQVRMKKGERETTLRLLPKINKDVKTLK